MTEPVLHKTPHRWPVVVIGIYKLLKATGLLILGFYLGYLLRADHHQALQDFIEQTREDPHSEWLYWVLEKILAVSHNTLNLWRVGVFVYAGLFLIEGVGLLFDKKWAEWMVIITSAGLIPVELYEIHVHSTWIRWLVFIANVVVVAYLGFRLKRMSTLKKEREGLSHSFPSAPVTPISPVPPPGIQSS